MLKSIPSWMSGLDNCHFICHYSKSPGLFLFIYLVMCLNLAGFLTWNWVQLELNLFPLVILTSKNNQSIMKSVLRYGTVLLHEIEEKYTWILKYNNYYNFWLQQTLNFTSLSTEKCNILLCKYNTIIKLGDILSTPLENLIILLQLLFIA